MVVLTIVRLKLTGTVVRVTGSRAGGGSSTVVSSVGRGGVVTATTPDLGSTGACLGAGPVTPPRSPVSVDCKIFYSYFPYVKSLVNVSKMID